MKILMMSIFRSTGWRARTARILKPEFTERFELGGGAALGRLIPNPFAEAVGR